MIISNKIKVKSSHKIFFKKNGYVILKNVINSKMANLLKMEIKKSKNVEIYFDKKNKIRRIEKIYNKGFYLKKINLEFIRILKMIFKKSFVIFKDKYNTKPPGGEGFYAHYDGVFKFIDKNQKIKNGWYYYGRFFVNILLALDKTTKKNGALEIAKADKGDFHKLYKNTKKNGTPDILKTVENKKKFNLINLDKGDVVIFSNTCAHRSKKNQSRSHRRSLYYTYSLKTNGSKYNLYFLDKKNSKNKNSKSLSGEI